MDVIPRERNRNDRDRTDSWNGTPLMEPTSNGDISNEVALCELKLRQVALQILHGNWPASQFSFTGSRGNEFETDEFAKRNIGGKSWEIYLQCPETKNYLRVIKHGKLEIPAFSWTKFRSYKPPFIRDFPYFKSWFFHCLECG